MTDGVLEEVKAWQSRPLAPLYAILYFDALMAHLRVEGRVSKRAIYLAVGINLEGRKEVLGFWAAESEGAKFC